MTFTCGRILSSCVDARQRVSAFSTTTPAAGKAVGQAPELLTNLVVQLERMLQTVSNLGGTLALESMQVTRS
jgi:hypothetical protein